jgi:phosphopantothenoylcysteine decarboxylase
LEEEWGTLTREEDIEDRIFEMLRPQERELACGDVGNGAMRDWREIVKVIEERLHLLN